MAGLDLTRTFVPLSIAILTVSDTRTAATDRSGDTLAQRVAEAGHALGGRTVVPDDRMRIMAAVRGFVADTSIDVVVTTGGTGFTGRDVTPEAIEPLFDKRMDGFSVLFHRLSFETIGTATVQSRATAGLIGTTFVFVLPGSPGACRDAWDGILVHQLDYRYRPCNIVELLPRLDEQMKRPKAGTGPQASPGR